MCLVSVITPVYNAMDTLTDCVQSVRKQNKANWEMILIDDGSSDGSSVLCDSLASEDSHIRVIHQENKGVSNARNKGLQAAMGQYVMFLDSDDELLPDALYIALDEQEKHPNCWILWRYTQGNPEKNFSFWGRKELSSQGISLLNAQDLCWLYNHCFFSMPWNKLYRMDIIQSHDLQFDSAYSLGEDLLFCLDYLAALGTEIKIPDICLIHRDLTFYRCEQPRDTLSTSYRSDYCDLWERLFDRLNLECDRWDCPQIDCNVLFRAELQIIAEGAAGIIAHDSFRDGVRRASDALRTPWVQALCRKMAGFRCYSPYYLPVRFCLTLLVCYMASSRTGSGWLYSKLDWAGWYLLGAVWDRG